MGGAGDSPEAGQLGFGQNQQEKPDSIIPQKENPENPVNPV